jgi:ferredoxin
MKASNSWQILAGPLWTAAAGAAGAGAAGAGAVAAAGGVAGAVAAAGGAAGAGAAGAGAVAAAGGVAGAVAGGADGAVPGVVTAWPGAGVGVAVCAKACDAIAVSSPATRTVFIAQAPFLPLKANDFAEFCRTQSAVASKMDKGYKKIAMSRRSTQSMPTDGRDAAAKAAALQAMAEIAGPDPTQVTLESRGTILVYGKDDVAIEAAELLKDRMDVSVLICGDGELVPPRASSYEIYKGRIVTAKGYLGAFALKIDGFSKQHPSGRGYLEFEPVETSATVAPDTIIDLSGNPPLFTAHDLRTGYLYADPGDRSAVMEALFRASGLVGTFDKPRFINFAPELCAHARSQIVGCHRCLDLCPTGAITPQGEHVVIDPYICAGCGECAAICPTGAASYAFPDETTVLSRLRALLITYRQAGGQTPIVLIHDGSHGADLIAALDRFGPEIPGHVLPVEVNEVTEIGIEAIAAAFSWGAAGVGFLTRSRPRHGMEGLGRTLVLAEEVLEGLGYGRQGLSLIQTDDPDVLYDRLLTLPLANATIRPSTYLPTGRKRELQVTALRELHGAAPSPVEVIGFSLQAGFGQVQLDVTNCTLCLACVSVCPTSALRDDPEKPVLRFDEALCVQCGLCKATCPEKVIELEPRISFAAFGAPPVTLKEEEPFCCSVCGKPFGTKSTIEKVIAKLQGKHWMFASGDASRLRLLTMCDDCRITSVTNLGFDPYAAPPRPVPRTTDDYLRDRSDRNDNGD